MSFLSILKTIGEDIEKGIAVAEPIIGAFVPSVGAILEEVAAIIGSLETVASIVPPASPTQPDEVPNLRALVQAVATVSAVNQHADRFTPPAHSTVDLLPTVANTLTRIAGIMQGGGSGGGPVPVPDPLPEPIPGGGPQDGYEFAFNQRYYETRDARLRPLAFGIAAGQDGNADALSQDDQTQLANDLYDWKAPGGPGSYGPDHVDFDEQTDYLRQGPYATNYQRLLVDGYQRVPVGTGTTTQPPNVVTKAELIGPPVPGKYLLVTCDINQL